MNSSGDITMWVVPSWYGLFRRSTTSPLRSRLSRPLAAVGRCGRPRDGAAQLFGLATLIGLATQPRMQAEALGIGAQGSHRCYDEPTAVSLLRALAVR